MINGLIEAWNAHDVSELARYHAPGYQGIDVGAAEPQLGPEGVRLAASSYFQAFPDLGFQVEEMVVHGTRVTLAWTATGTHQGMLMHIPATGKRVSVRGISLLTIKQGQVQRALHLWDVAGLLRAIGLLPEL